MNETTLNFDHETVVTNHDSGSTKRSLAIFLFPCIVIVALILRSLHLVDRSVWFDESSSWRLVQFPFFEMCSRILEDIHPPLYFLVLKLWRGLFGDSVLMLRGLSVLFSVASLILVYRFTLRLFSEDSKRTDTKRLVWTIACLASALFAVNVFQIRQAWEMRMYSLGVFLTLLSTIWLYETIFRKNHKIRNWILYGIAIAFCLYTHYTTLFSIAGQFIFVVCVLLRDVSLKKHDQILLSDFKAACYGYGLGVLVFLPWLGVFVHQHSMVKESWWNSPFQWQEVPKVFSQAIVPWQCCDFLPNAAMVMFVVVVSAFGFAIYRFGLHGWFLTCVGLVPFLLLIVQSIVGTNLMTDRYLAFQQPFYLIAFASLLALSKDDLFKFIFVISIITWGGDAYYSYLDKLDIKNRPGARGAVMFLSREKEEGDLVLVANPLLYFPIRTYSGPESGVRVYSPSGDNFVHFCGGPLTCPEDFMTDYEMQNTTKGRVWVITTNGGWSSDFPFEIPQSWKRLENGETFPDLGCPQAYVVQLYQADPIEIPKEKRE